MVKPKKPTGTRYKKPKYRNISTIRRLPKSNTTNITPAVNFQLFTPNFQFPGLKSGRVPTPEEEEEEEEEEEKEENIRVDIEDTLPLNNNRGPPISADYDEDDWHSNNRGPPRAVKHKWYVNDNRILPRAEIESCYDVNRGPPRAAASASSASCFDFNRGLPRAAAQFDSDKYQESIRKELEDIGAIAPKENDMIERTFHSSDIPVYPVTSTRVEIPSLMQISLGIKDIEAKIRETRAICESNTGTHLPVCVASAFTALGLMLPQQLIDEIKYQRESEAGIPDKLLLDYLYRKNIITSKTMLDFKDEADLITKIQLLLKKGNSTIITVYGGCHSMSHMVLIVNAGPHIDRSGRDRSGVYCVDILADIIIELDGDDTPFIKYLSQYERETDSIFVYNGLTINEKRGVKRKEKEEIQIRKKKLEPSKKRRLEGGRKTRKHVHL
jgi:hypothetical protein